MARFEFRFEVGAPHRSVAELHRHPRALRWLTPPPIIMVVRKAGPLAEDMLASFTMWMGPIPMAWQALHTEVSDAGFRDTAVVGPMKRWSHRHDFTPIDEHRTLIHETIDYEHPAGLKGIFTRLMFNPLALRGLFMYRAWSTRRLLKRWPIAS